MERKSIRGLCTQRLEVMQLLLEIKICLDDRVEAEGGQSSNAHCEGDFRTNREAQANLRFSNFTNKPESNTTPGRNNAY